MEQKKYNYLGEDITGVQVELLSPDFGDVDEDGNVHPHWTPENEDVDGRGFDKHYHGTSGYFDEIELPYGTLLERFGPATGRMTADYGIDYESLGLPYKPETVEFHVYRVIADSVVVRCQVKRGKAYKMFDSPGGAIQYLHRQSILKEMDDNKLEEVMLWKA